MITNFRRRSANTSPEPAAATKMALLGTIFGSFVLGAVFGTMATVRFHQWAMAAPALAVGVASLAAFRSTNA